MRTPRSIALTFTLVVSIVFLAFPSPGEAAKKKCDGLERLGKKERPKTLIQDYYGRLPRSLNGLSTKEENNRYLEFIKQPANAQVRYLHVGLIPLRDLNTGEILDSKEDVDAARNLFREILLSKIHENPALRARLAEQFIDFKTMEFAFRTPLPQNMRAMLKFEGQLNKALTDAQMEFEKKMLAYMKADGVVPEQFLRQRGLVSDLRSWHVAGYGIGHPDYAAAQVRFNVFNPELTAPLHFHRFNKDEAQKYLNEAEAARKKLEKTRGFTTLMTEYEGGGQKVLSRPAMEIARKVKHLPMKEAVKQITEKVKKRLKLTLTPEEAKALFTYYQAADRFQPPVRASEPIKIDFRSAKHGIISVDFGGQGHVNAHHTMGALLAANQEDLGGVSAIQHSREMDATATARLTKLQQTFQKALTHAGIHTKVQYTGDDGAALLDKSITAEQYRKVLSYLAKEPEVGNNRVVYSLPLEKGPETSDHVRAELFEKEIREDLHGQIQDQRLSQLAIGSTINIKDGTMEVFIFGKPTAYELKLIQEKIKDKNPFKDYRIVNVTALAD